MKKISIVLLICLSCLTLILSSCGGDKHTHSYSSWTVVTPADCTHNGQKERACSCGDKQIQEIPMLGHNYIGGVCVDCGGKE